MLHGHVRSFLNSVGGWLTVPDLLLDTEFFNKHCILKRPSAGRPSILAAGGDCFKHGRATSLPVGHSERTESKVPSGGRVMYHLGESPTELQMYPSYSSIVSPANSS